MNDQPKTVSPAPQVAPIGSPEETGLSPGGLAKLTAIMQREIDARRLPGVSMMIARGGKVGYRRDLGVLRPGGPIMPGDAIFRIYSMTKPIVSVALMMLVEDGRLFIADPVANTSPNSPSEVGVGRGARTSRSQTADHGGITAPYLGATYGYESAVQRLYGEARLFRDLSTPTRDRTRQKLPLLERRAWPGGTSHHRRHRPHHRVISGQTLGAFLRERLSRRSA
jgi:CubicO group peptidase (beta-lactamase class C family)